MSEDIFDEFWEDIAYYLGDNRANELKKEFGVKTEEEPQISIFDLI